MSEPAFTVLGGHGFIGSRLVKHITKLGYPCEIPSRGDDLRGLHLGHVIYCIGLTGDFRERPLETIDAHVGVLAELVRSSQFDSLVYLSSTRVYKRNVEGKACEEDELRVNPLEFDDIYGLSKMTGEAIAHVATGARTHVVRLSNVYGDDFEQPGFLPAILKEAVTDGVITLETGVHSSRDYVSVADVVDLVTRIAIGGRERSYNVASGANLTNGELAGALSALTGCTVFEQPDARTVTFPEIDIRRICGEFGAAPASLLDELPRLVESCAQYWSNNRVLD